MANGKGKGRAEPAVQESGSEKTGNPPRASQEPSLLSKVVTSASGLSRATLAAPNQNEYVKFWDFSNLSFTFSKLPRILYISPMWRPYLHM